MRDYVRRLLGGKRGAPREDGVISPRRTVKSREDGGPIARQPLGLMRSHFVRSGCVVNSQF